MTFKRTMDAAFLNVVANDPDVRPWLGGEGDLDLANVVGNPENLALVTDNGGWILIKQEPQTFELHTLFRKAGRGIEAFTAGREALRYVFTSTEAREIVTKLPMNNRGAVSYARRAGFQERFSRANAWDCGDGTMAHVSYQALTLDRWVSLDDRVISEGEWFHSQFEAFALPPHPDDEAHERAVGASVLMMRAGRHAKGCWFYNRWARLAGYPLVRLINEAPVMVDMSVPSIQTVVEVRDGQMEVLLCRSV